MSMKLAFSNALCPEHDFNLLIEKARAWGYDGFEFDGTHGQADLGNGSPLAADSEVIRRKLDHAGQALVALNTGATFCQHDGSATANVLHRIQDCIRLAAEIGCPFVGVSGSATPSGFTRVAALEQSARTLHSLATTAGEHGVTLLLENAGAFASTQDAWFLRDAANLPTLRLCLNLVNAYEAGDPPSVAIPRLAAATSVVHLGDGELDSNGRMKRFATLGQGMLDIPYALELLKGLAYDGWLCVHWPNAAREQLPPPDELLPAAAQYLRAELDKSPVELTAYKGDKNAPRFAEPAAGSVAPDGA